MVGKLTGTKQLCSQVNTSTNRQQAGRRVNKQRAGIHTGEKEGGHVSNQGDIQAQGMYRRRNTCIHAQKNKQTEKQMCTRVHVVIKIETWLIA